MTKRKPKTLDDIAEYCGVSASTVSRVLNNEPGISLETRTKILETVDKFNFAVQKRKKQITRVHLNLAIIVPDQSEVSENPFYDMTDLLNSINSVFVDNRKKIEILTFSQFESSIIEPNFHVDGIIFAFGTITEKVRKILNDFGISYVFLNRTLEHDNYVSCNNFKGMIRLHKYLSDRGHKKIGYLGYGNHPINRDRHRGYIIGAIENSGNYNNSHVHMIDSIEAIDGRTVEFFLKKECDAVMCFNDNFAIRFINELSKIKISVPNDISITGFDNSPMRKLFRPEITTINLSAFEMGFFATRWLMDNILTKGARRLHCEVDGDLLEGNTVRKRKV